VLASGAALLQALEAGQLEVEGNALLAARFFACPDQFDTGFAVVTP
jgi:alkyl sulfatase BDS1-like metallo-beta-lactamase superfamily hydrolase